MLRQLRLNAAQSKLSEDAMRVLDSELDALVSRCMTVGIPQAEVLNFLHDNLWVDRRDLLIHVMDAQAAGNATAERQASLAWLEAVHKVKLGDVATISRRKGMPIQVLVEDFRLSRTPAGEWEMAFVGPHHEHGKDTPVNGTYTVSTQENVFPAPSPASILARFTAAGLDVSRANASEVTA